MRLYPRQLAGGSALPALIRRIAFPILILIAALSACTANPTPVPPQPSPTPAPTIDLAATIAAGAVATIAAMPTPVPTPTSTPAPTATPQPTYTPYPTATPYPTPQPLPTHTPYPTPQPLPTHTPYPTATAYPTATPLPTHTPYPTATSYPTATPYPTPRPVIRTQTVVETDNWKEIESTDETNIGTYATIGKSGFSEFWILQISCNTDETFVWLNDVQGNMFSNSWGLDSYTESLLVTIDDRTEEQSWYYFPPEGSRTDLYSARWAHNLLRNLLDAEKLEINIPTSGNDYIISFDVDGLDRHISSASDCGSG